MTVIRKDYGEEYDLVRTCNGRENSRENVMPNMTKNNKNKHSFTHRDKDEKDLYQLKLYVR